MRALAASARGLAVGAAALGSGVPGALLVDLLGRVGVGSCGRRTVSATSRDTTIATYASPAICSSITRRARTAWTGTTSLSPVLDSVVKLRNSSSIHVRGRSGVDRRDEAAGIDRLADREGVGERPRDERERRADREQLVARDLVVGQHVGDQRAGGVEVQDRLERRGVRQQRVVAGHGLDQQQDGRGDAEQDPTHVSAGRARTASTTSPRIAMPKTLNSARPTSLSSMNGYSSSASS